MIQDIESIHIEYKNVKPEQGDLLLSFQERKVVYPFLAAEEDKDAIYAFSIGNQRFFLSLKEYKLEYQSIDILRHMENREYAYAIATGYHLYLWYRNHSYCPSCKEGLFLSTKERALCCKCGYIEYPRISPAVIVGILHEDKILLTKYKIGYKNYALVAGYSEIGESFEDTCRREVMEEVGLKIKNITYYKSQPWGMSGSILAGFFCEVDGDSTIHVDGEELGFGRLFSRDEIELEDDHTTLTREMILHFKRGEIVL